MSEASVLMAATNGPSLRPAEVKVGTGVGAFGVPIPDQNHADQVDDNGENDENAG
jgi:hypothetical protein